MEALQDLGRIVREGPVDGVLPAAYQPPMDQWLRYLERVDSAGGLCILGSEEVPRHKGVALTAGFFSVPKDATRARGITDRRPQHSMEFPFADTPAAAALVCWKC